jgi:predicted alpha-1,2-mannosidase
MYLDVGFWDVYRTSFPLYSILFPSLLREMLEAWVNVYKESGWMPKWVSPGERSVMPGTLIDAVFADAYVKGVRDFDVQTAYEGLWKHAVTEAEDPALGRRGVRDYERHGYLPADRYRESVSNALDYVYGDFCIAQLAEGLGRHDEARLLRERARNYVKLFDPAVGFMRARLEDGSFREPFDQFEWGGAYCEGGPWQCSWAVQHDLAGLADLMGGPAAFKAKLDELMTMEPIFKVGRYGYEIHEMSEMAAVDFGQFAISNQPSFHIPYIYTALGYPAETQYWVRRTLETLFSPRPDGLPGDEDNGSMAAWYLFSAIGMYPLCPGVPEYVLTSPLFSRVTLHLPGGRRFVIEAEQAGENRVYIGEVRLNGAAHDALYLTHEQLMAGGTLSVKMTELPAQRRYSDEQLPYSMSRRSR